MEQFRKTVYGSQQYTIGASFPKDGKGETWAKAATVEPMPITYILGTMDSLLAKKLKGVEGGEAKVSMMT